MTHNIVHERASMTERDGRGESESVEAVCGWSGGRVATYIIWSLVYTLWLIAVGRKRLFIKRHCTPPPRLHG